MNVFLSMNEHAQSAVNAPDRWRLSDTADGYGWISISLHWLSALAVVALLLVGTAIRNAKAGEATRLIDLHTSIAGSSYVLLWARVIWRFKVGHPDPLSAQNKVFFRVAKITHYALILALATMLLSGPLMVWSRGNSINVFQMAIPSPWGYAPLIASVMRAVHGSMGWVLIGGLLLHVAGALKHTAFDRDGTLGRMLAPPWRKSTAQRMKVAIGN
jgi:cytochrome b561